MVRMTVIQITLRLVFLFGFVVPAEILIIS